jgi:DNA-binding NarL/FixJ family response regulator
MPEKSKVFLVDDHPLVREWLTNLNHQEDNLIVCGEAEDAAAALRGIEKTKPDVVIVDLSLRGSSGIELIKAARLKAPATAIIVLSMHDENLYAERVIRAGARGYVMKRETAQKIIAGIQRVLKGELYFSDSIANAFARKFVDGPSAAALTPMETLSDRELEVFNLLGQGFETRRIAESLNVSIKTVQAYCSRIREKLHISNGLELLREAMRWHDQSAGGQ